MAKPRAFGPPLFLLVLVWVVRSAWSAAPAPASSVVRTDVVAQVHSFELSTGRITTLGQIRSVQKFERLSQSASDIHGADYWYDEVVLRAVPHGIPVSTPSFHAASPRSQSGRSVRTFPHGYDLTLLLRVSHYGIATETGGDKAGAESPTVGEVLEGKKGSITKAPLPEGSPSWDAVRGKTMDEI